MESPHVKNHLHQSLFQYKRALENDIGGVKCAYVGGYERNFSKRGEMPILPRHYDHIAKIARINESLVQK